jgi:hypothetical protein
MNVISVFSIVQQAEKTIFVQSNFLRDISLLLLWPQNPFSILQDEMEMKERRKPELSKNQNTLIKTKIKFSSYIGKFRVEQLQSHI